MGLRTEHSITRVGPLRPIGVSPWPSDVAQLLEEHHLVAWAHGAAEREKFARVLAASLRAMPDTQVCELDGRKITDLQSLMTELSRGLGESTGEATIDGANGLLAILRQRPPEPAATGAGAAGSAAAGGSGVWSAIKRRYYIWNEADLLLRKDPALFGRAVDAITGVAAEAEYASEDLLLIHRAVFVGGPALDVYAEDPRGQFRSWLREITDQGHAEDRPLWEVVSGLKRPPVLPFHIGVLD